MTMTVAGRTPPAAGEAAANRVTSVEANLLNRLRTGDLQQFVVDFSPTADLSAAWSLKSFRNRGQFVIDRLRSTADSAQRQAREVVAAAGATAQTFWIRNSMIVRGDAALAERLSRLPGVSGVRSERTFPLVKPVEQKLNVTPTVGSPEWGVDKIGADEVWALGVTGSGVVVGNIDTGVDYLHEALVNQYRGNLGGGTFDHNYNWWDPTGICGDSPCDNAGHGTHTMGTMVGGDGPGDFEPDIGVAFGANWIAAKGCEDFGCSEFALLSSGEFMLAPTDLAGDNPDPSLRPHILNNSWGGGPGDPWYLDVVTAWRASGIIPVFSSGNPGPACGDGGSPGDYIESFSAGATDIDDVIADFSGRGPSIFGKINPDVSAPGVDVVSSIPGDEYASFSGTSMAAPHTAGTLALMLSAAPGLKGDFEAATSAVRDTAFDIIDESCGGDEDGDPNNVYGEGRIDALAAVELVASGGTLTGTVTDSGTGDPIAGAEITADGVDDFIGISNEAGVYELFVGEGTYDVSADAYGYAVETVADVEVVEGEETVLDFALDPLPVAVVSGTVTDASGHGWPLYARIDIEGYPGGPVFTDPVTGDYSIELVQSTDFVFRVTAVYGAYVEAVRDVGPLSGDATEDFSLTVDADICDAPGYALEVDGLFEPFNEDVAPDGWEVIDNNGSGGVWVFDDPGGRGNLTGGTGNFAIVDSDNLGPGGSQDTELVTPLIDLTSVDTPAIRFSTDYFNLGDTADVDLSIDGGTTWTNVLSWDESMRGPLQEVIDIPDAANEAEVKVRFHYYDAAFAWWWQVDNVIIGGEPSCAAQEGGLLVGNVYDDITGLALNGATVTSDEDPSITATTVATPEDEGLDDGFYLLFSSLTGAHPFTATASLYSPSTETPDIVGDSVVRQDFALGAGLLTTDPDEIEVTVPFGGTTTATLTISNEGTADATYEISERDQGFEILFQRGADVVRRAGTFSPYSLANAPKGSINSSGPFAAPNDAPWTDISDFPISIMDNTGDAFDGKVYSVGGFDGGANLSDAYAYDPGSDSWTQLASMNAVREKPAAAFVDGLLYVVGGWDDGGTPSDMLEIYDPGSDTWTTGASVPTAYAAAVAVEADGKLYVIGGCGSGSCGSTDVFVYDPSGDSWSSAAPYPEDISWTHCANIDGLIYCAGGVSDANGETSSTYAYDPGADAWTPLAAMPQTQWAGGYVGAGGVLLVSGGVTDNFATVTNEGFGYDPGSDSWSPIPNSNNVAYRGGSACGFYKVGGSTGGFSPTPASEVLPGMDVCGVSPDVTWLGVDPTTDTVAPAGSSEVTVSFDAGVAEVVQPGAYRALLTFKEDTPYVVAPVAVTMNVTPPADWGKLEGTVTGLARCDAPGDPLAGADVHIDGVNLDFDVTTDASGLYEWWMPADNDPLALTVSKDGWVTKTGGVFGLTPGNVTTRNFTLRLAAPCAETSPDAINITLLQNDSVTRNLQLQNVGGARGYSFSIDETEFGLGPLVNAGGNGNHAFSAATAAGGPMSARSLTRGNGTSVAPNAPPWFGATDIPGGLVRFGHTQCDGDENTFYVVGGVDGTFNVSDSLWRFDAGTTEWTALAPMPEGAEGPTATCDAGRIYVLGGDGSDRHYVYDIGSDSWTTAAPLPRPVWGAASASWDGKVFLIGGDSDFSFGGTSDEVNIYDSATDSWTGTGTPMPVAAATPGYYQAGQYLYVVGGWGDDSPDINLAASQRYDLTSDTWETGPDLAAPRADMALAVTDTAIYAIAGDEDGNGPFDSTRVVERLELGDWSGGSWTMIDQIGVPLTSNNGGFCSTATFDPGTEVWSAGGLDGTSFSIQGRMYFRQAAGEACTTIRSDVPWLSTVADQGFVARDATRTVKVTIDADDLSVGEHDATLLIATSDPAHPEMRVPVNVTVEARPIVAYVSVRAGATIEGLTVRDEDVVTVYDDGSVEMYFDGSDLGMNGLAIDAFAQSNNGSLIMSFTQPAGVPGIIGTVDDSDLVRFVATSLGTVTSGTFVRWFDGSDVGLTTDDEDIDAVDIRPNGSIAISTLGPASVPGVANADDSDLLRFTPTQLGLTTAGSWVFMFDGSDVGLSTNNEDIDAVAIGAAIQVSTVGPMAVPGLTAADEDVATFHSTQLGQTTEGTWDALLLVNGSNLGLADNDITAVELPNLP